MVSETACSLLTNKGNAGLRVHHHVNETLKPAKGKWQCPLIFYYLFLVLNKQIVEWNWGNFEAKVIHNRL